MTARLVSPRRARKPPLTAAQSCGENLRNASQLLTAQIAIPRGDDDFDTMVRANELLRLALTQLGEPNAACVAAVRRIVETHSDLIAQRESPEAIDRYFRDSAAVILKAQIEGTP